MNQKLKLILLILTTTLFFSCENILTGEQVDEGKILFKIEYLDDEKDNPLISLLPKEMTIIFKENNTVSHINGFFGTFKLTYITDSENKMNYSILRVMDKKYIYKVNDTEEPAGYNEMKDIRIEETEETDTIAGYLCHIAKAYCPQISDKPINLYYTYEINIKNPNANTPYKEIDGVLLGFQVKLTGINMKFVAEKVIEAEIDNSEFNIPKGYEPISKEEMEEILTSFQEQ